MREWKYTALFPDKAPRALRETDADELLDLLKAVPGSTGDLPAGYTYLGQFAVHDLTFLRQNEQPVRFKRNGTLRRVSVDRLTSRNKPALDLDSVYGGGPSDATIPFDHATGAFLLWPAGSEKDQDLPRSLSREGRLVPLIGDPRNDDNLLTAQIQVLFMRFHNRIIEDLEVSGIRDPDYLFQRARVEVTKVYQYLVLHDLSRRLVPEAVYEAVLLQGRGALSTPRKLDPTMALEFADAACRLHSLVRVSYTLNDRRSINLQNSDGAGRLTGRDRTIKSTKRLLQNDDVVDWRHFFEFSNYPKQTKNWQHANAISFALNPLLRKLERLAPRKQQRDLLKDNTLRGSSHGLRTGQEVCRELRKRFPDLSVELGLQCLDQNGFVLGKLSNNNSLRTRTPLWVYLMIEAERGKMGVLGGWIIADVLRTAALNSDIRLRDVSDTQAKEVYGPLKDATQNRKAITIEDVIMYTYDYPPNRQGRRK